MTTIYFVIIENEFIDVDLFINDEIKNCFAIDEVFTKKFLMIDKTRIILVKNVFDLINFKILTQRLLT